jgi:hypothetical protein
VNYRDRSFVMPAKDGIDPVKLLFARTLQRQRNSNRTNKPNEQQTKQKATNDCESVSVPSLQHVHIRQGECRHRSSKSTRIKRAE